MKSTGDIVIAPHLPAALAPLERLALNLRWSWRRETRELFRDIDHDLWETIGHPKGVLAAASASRLDELSHSDEFLGRMEEEINNLNFYLGESLWYQNTHLGAPGADGRTDRDPVGAYFSMEFGITPSLPIYSGGLGILSGDHMKSASDLGVPLIGVGLLYTYGYFQQSLNREGWQEENYAPHPPADLPVRKVVDEQGNQVQVSVDLAGDRHVAIALWVAEVGRVPLLLLDTNIDANDQWAREITDRLYGGDSEHRIVQEIVLGIGGVRAVNAFCAAEGLNAPRIAHLNEGHAGLLGLERVAERMAEGDDFETALVKVKNSQIFTTHTPVPAGIDRFDMALVRRYLDADEQGNSRLCPGVPVEPFIALGREADPHRFNLAHLGLRTSQRANGVAKLHGVVSREMFASLYPGFEPAEVPIGSVTNGVHLPTWTKPEALEIIQRVSRNADLAVADEWSAGDAVSNEELWELRNKLRADLVDVTRVAMRSSWEHRGVDAAELRWTKAVLDPNVLTVGFARRVATYKRLTLMLRNPQRLRALLTNPERPVQFIIAGKAHPHDMGGKQLMQQIIRFADDAGVRDKFIFLPDYDMNLASYLISGSDIWLNNPIRPQEASGTSGMKAVMNGCMTLSISDGWWDEMPQEDHGWTIPSVDTTDSGWRDEVEAQALYDLIEEEIAPVFYDRDENGMPTEWLRRVRRSMVEISPLVTSTRMVRDYTDEYYRPANASAAAVTADADTAKNFVAWREHITTHFDEIQLRHKALTGAGGRAIAGTPVTLSAELALGEIDAQDVTVQALVGRTDAEGEIIDPQIITLAQSSNGSYAAELTLDDPGAYGYTLRLVPNHPLLASHAELGLVRYL